jgi:hypothetical protein
VSHLESLIVPAGSGLPAFNLNHDYHLTLNLTGKGVLYAVPHGPAGSDTWSGGLRLDFTGTSSSPPTGSIPLAVATTPTAFGIPVSLKVALGGVGVVGSPLIGNTSEVTVSETGASTDDAVVAVLNACVTARTYCYFRAVKATFDWARWKRNVIQDAFQDQAAIDRDALALGFHLGQALVECLAVVNAQLNDLIAQAGRTRRLAAAASTRIKHRRARHRLCDARCRQP